MKHKRNNYKDNDQYETSKNDWTKFKTLLDLNSSDGYVFDEESTKKLSEEVRKELHAIHTEILKHKGNNTKINNILFGLC